MPISSNIIQELELLDEEKEIKNLVLQILEETDKGSSHYKDAYDKLIDGYLDLMRNKTGDEYED